MSRHDRADHRLEPHQRCAAHSPSLTKPEFHPDGVYRINIDPDGDVQADVAFTFVFSEVTDGEQTGTA